MSKPDVAHPDTSALLTSHETSVRPSTFASAPKRGAVVDASNADLSEFFALIDEPALGSPEEQAEIVESLCDRILMANPSLAEAVVQRARTARKTGRHLIAAALLKPAFARRPNDVAVCLQLAIALEALTSRRRGRGGLQRRDRDRREQLGCV